MRPAFQRRQREQVRLVRLDDLLTHAALDDLRRQAAELGEFGQLFELLHQRRRHLRLEDVLDAGRDHVEVVGTKRQAHTLLGAEGVDQKRDTSAFDVLEQQRRTAGFRDAVGDLGDFKDRIDLDGDTFEPAALLKLGDEDLQIGCGHEILLRAPNTPSLLASWSLSPSSFSSCYLSRPHGSSATHRVCSC